RVDAVPVRQRDVEALDRRPEHADRLDQQRDQHEPDDQRGRAGRTALVRTAGPDRRAQRGGRGSCLGWCEGHEVFQACSAWDCQVVRIEVSLAGFWMKSISAVFAVFCSASVESRLKNWVSWSAAASIALPLRTSGVAGAVACGLAGMTVPEEVAVHRFCAAG